MLRVLASLVFLGFAVIALSAAAPDVSMGAEAVDPAKGKSSYTMYCVTCHGEKGDGKGPASASLEPPPRDFSKGAFSFDTDADGQTGTDADLAAVIKNGAAKYGGSLLMTPWAHLPPEEIQHLIAYIRSLQVPATASAQPASDPPKP
jgi:mono/diheme cytochrome c family protein